MIFQQKEEIECSRCIDKKQTIQKFSHLVTLLKKKATKYDSSKIKSHIETQRTHEQIILSQLYKYNRLPFALLPLARRQLFSCFKKMKNQSNLSPPAFLIIENKFKKILSQGFAAILRATYRTNISTRDECSNFLKEVGTGVSSGNIEMGQYKSIAKQFKPGMSQKDIYKKCFRLHLKNQEYQRTIKLLKWQLQQGIKRQQKQILKKRQGIKMLSEQLSQKNQIIDQLKLIINKLEVKGKGEDKKVGTCMLEEDSHNLKKGVFRLENINDKLNLDVDKLKKECMLWESQNLCLKKQNEDLKQKIKKLKEVNFDLEQSKAQVMAQRKQIEFMSHKINCKIERLKNIERRHNQASRAKENVSNNILQNIQKVRSQKKITETTENIILQRSNPLRDVQIESKIQLILTYLFHIDDNNYELHSPQLFDQQEKELLLNHKHKYLENIHINLQPNIKKMKRKCSSDSDSIEIFNDFEMKSIADVLNQTQINNKERNIPSQNIKLIELQVQKCKMISKISELKDRQMHIRNVVLNLLKSLQLKSIKKQADAIAAILCDIFEYSEEQKCQIFQIRNKKLFGFI